MADCTNCIHCLSEAKLMGKESFKGFYCTNLNIKDLSTDRAEFCTFYTPKNGKERKLKEREILEIRRDLLLEMPEAVISEKFGISNGYVKMLYSALKPKRFDMLSDKDLPPSEISQRLDLSESSVRAYLTALKKVNLLDS